MKRAALALALVPLLQQAGRAEAAPAPASAATAPAAPTPASLDDRKVSATIVPGTIAPAKPTPPPDRVLAGGDVTLNFPGVDIQQVARAVLGDILRVPYTIDPMLHGTVTVVTDRPLARGAVIPFMEGALRASNLALVDSNGTYIVATVEQAKNQAVVVGDANTGFGGETFQLKFVSADQLKKLIDPVLPGVVVSADTARNVLTIAGTTGQRRSARDLVQQFDVNWLRAMSFALFVPERTDARLIVPELDKLINAPSSPTNGLVKLVAMERLNGILAVSPQAQYLEDVRRWVEILDREGENNEPRLFVYHVQNGRSADLAKTLLAAFGASNAGGGNRGGGAPARASGISLAGLLGTSSTTGSDLGAAPTDNTNTPSGSPLQAPLTSQSATVSIGAAGTGLPTSPNSPSGPGSSAVSGTTPSGITITSDEANNAVVIFATPRTYAVIEDALRRLDVPPLQVLIEAAIAEVTLTKDLSYGVQWLFHAGGGSIGYTENTTSALPTQIFPGLSGVLARQNITATLNALSNITTVNVLSAPDLLVVNNQTASLQVGDQVPISTGAQTSELTGALTQAIEYRDTGVILKITPRVNASGVVLLDVAQEVSAVSSTSSSDLDSPIISTRKVATSIAAQDGETIALGGLITTRDEKGKVGIPILSTLPIIGALFGTHTVKQDRTELVVLLKPRVIRSVDDGRAVTDELRDKLQALRNVTKKPSDLP